MSTQTKRELLLNLRQEYLVAGRKTKSRLLDGFVTATGYDRKYAISLLNSPPREIVIKRSRKKMYDDEVFTALKRLWTAANGICPRRLIPFLPKLLVSLERFGHIKVSSAVRTKLLAMSASTAERMLRSERQQNGKGKGLTRPGSLLRKQIAIKTFADWNDNKVGFFEIDLVAHCGGDISGKFVNTLTMTDIATGWTEMYSLLYKNEEFVRAALDWASEDLPFKIKGLDTDNGGEFLNHGMVDWCASRQITFTRSRAVTGGLKARDSGD